MHYPASADGLFAVTATIPAFPAFAPLSIEHKDHFEELVFDLPPHGERSFASWFAWDTSGSTRIAELFGNVVLLWQGAERRTYGTFLGCNRPEATALALLRHLSVQSPSSELRLVQTEAAELLGAPIFSVCEDRDHFDYIYDAKCLSTLSGPDYRDRRQLLSRFTRRFKTTETPLDLTSNETVQAILNLHRRWKANKKLEGKLIPQPLLWRDEEYALRRIVDSAKELSISAIGIWDDAYLVAFSLSEILAPNFAAIQFIKADTHNYVGSFEAIMQKTARTLFAEGCDLINFGEDLGITSLRVSKMRYRPLQFQKKFTVSLPAAVSL